MVSVNVSGISDGKNFGYSAAHPSAVGPVTVYPGLTPREAHFHAAGWHHLNIHEDQTDENGSPTKEHAKKILTGLRSIVPIPLQICREPLYFLWRNSRLGAVEARLRAYIPTYIEGVCRSLEAMRTLNELREASTENKVDLPTLVQEFICTSREPDYKLLLAALLNGLLRKALHKAAHDTGIPPLHARELPPDLSQFTPSEELADLAGGASVAYRKNFLGLMADRYFQLFAPGGGANIPWSRGTIIRFNRTCKESHDTAHFGDPGTSYEYAGKKHVPLSWDRDPSGALRELLEMARFVTGKPINFCLMNYYKLGDSIGAHSDNETDLIPDVGVFSVSLGYPRLFEMRAKSAAVRGTPLALRLQHGSALWMKGRTQTTHVHWIDAEKGKPLPGTVALVRVNLTFRAVRTHAQRARVP